MLSVIPQFCTRDACGIAPAQPEAIRRFVNPEIGKTFHDMMPVIKGLPSLSEADTKVIFEENACKLFKRD